MPVTVEAASQRAALIERLMQSAGGMFDIYTTYLGYHLGFYEPLTTPGGCTSSELAGRTGTHERHVREWLEQQTVVGTRRNTRGRRSRPCGERAAIPPVA
jgi:hypothetical protein